MTAFVIDGRKLSEKLCENIKLQTSIIHERYSIRPCLAVVVVGDNGPSLIYVAAKKRKALELGIEFIEFFFPADAAEEEVSDIIKILNGDKNVHGILFQLPCPAQIDKNKIMDLISPEKDVDGFCVRNAGLLFTSRLGEALLPCTPRGCLMLIESYDKLLAGKRAVVVGSSNVVGRPMAQMLLERRCTVAVTHSATVNLKEECARADILVVATGVAGLIKKDFVKTGAIVIDVGISRKSAGGKKEVLLGDVDFEEVSKVAGAITSVPGGVGPMTVACLMLNVLIATSRQKRFAQDISASIEQINLSP